jgi:hypothetical protein
VPACGPPVPPGATRLTLDHRATRYAYRRWPCWLPAAAATAGCQLVLVAVAAAAPRPCTPGCSSLRLCGRWALGRLRCASMSGPPEHCQIWDRPPQYVLRYVLHARATRHILLLFERTDQALELACSATDSMCYYYPAAVFPPSACIFLVGWDAGCWAESRLRAPWVDGSSIGRCVMRRAAAAVPRRCGAGGPPCGRQGVRTGTYGELACRLRAVVANRRLSRK